MKLSKKRIDGYGLVPGYGLYPPLIVVESDAFYDSIRQLGFIITDVEEEEEEDKSPDTNPEEEAPAPTQNVSNGTKLFHEYDTNLVFKQENNVNENLVVDEPLAGQIVPEVNETSATSTATDKELDELINKASKSLAEDMANAKKEVSDKEEEKPKRGRPPGNTTKTKNNKRK